MGMKIGKTKKIDTEVIQILTLLAIGMVAASMFGLYGPDMLIGAATGENECGDTLPILYGGRATLRLDDPGDYTATRSLSGRTYWAKVMAHPDSQTDTVYYKVECYDRFLWAESSMREDVASAIKPYFDEYRETMDPETGKGGSMPTELEAVDQFSTDLNARCAKGYIEDVQKYGLYRFRFVKDAEGDPITVRYTTPIIGSFAASEMVGQQGITLGDELVKGVICQKKGITPMTVTVSGQSSYNTDAPMGQVYIPPEHVGDYTGDVDIITNVEEQDDGSVIEEKVSLPENVASEQPELVEWWEEQLEPDTEKVGKKVWWSQPGNMLLFLLGAVGAFLIAGLGGAWMSTNIQKGGRYTKAASR